MPRARNIKPGFFINEELAECDLAARLLFIGLWCLADREGRLKDRPKRIGAFVFPYEHYDIDDLLNQLYARGFIVRYEANGEKYIQIVNFKKHQNPHIREAESEIPAPDQDNNCIMQGDECNDGHLIQAEDNNDIEPNQHHTSTIQAPDKHGTSPADSLLLIPDSLLLIPDSPLPLSGANTCASKIDARACTEKIVPNKEAGQDLDCHTANSVSDTGVEADKVTAVSGYNSAGKSSEQPRSPFKSMLQQKRFDSFWAKYPKKKSKGQAEKTWVKINPDNELFEAIMHGLELAKKSADWTKDNGQFIPYPSTWLNAKGWEDEFTPPIRGQPQKRVNRRDMPFDEYMADVCGEGWEQSVRLPWVNKDGGD
jgi:hypothetical protein